VWLTTVDSAVMHDPAEAQRALAFLRHNGFRRAALPLYTAGVVTWSPAPARNRLAIPTDPLLPPSTAAGPTASLLAALGRAGLERVGWFEFGLMAPVGAPWLAGRDDLLLRDASGSSLWQESPGLNRVWLNPILPEVQQLLEDLHPAAAGGDPVRRPPGLSGALRLRPGHPGGLAGHRGWPPQPQPRSRGAGLDRLASRAGHGSAGAAARCHEQRLPSGADFSVAQSPGVFLQQLSGRLEQLGAAGAGG
jgi:hypothetical protein